MSQSPKGPIILYGSQTGNAEAIARMVHVGLAAIPGLPAPRISTMAAYVKQDTAVRINARAV